MAEILVTGPVQEPVTLEDVKTQLRLDTDDEDGWLVSVIHAARQSVEAYTHRALVTQTWDLRIDGNWPMKNGGPRIDLPRNPIQSVSWIRYQDDDGTSPEPTLAATQYKVAARRNNSYIVPAYDVEWPTVRDVPDAIRVRFVAGYDSVDDIPEPLIHAIRLLCSHWYENREVVNFDRMQAAEMPYSIEALLSPYRSARVLG